ncbi:hypothetical protein [Anaerosporobacter sp.]
MNKGIKSFFAILIVCIMFLSGCTPPSQEETPVNEPQDNVTQAYNTTLEKSGLRTYIDVFENELFYMEMVDNSAEFYVYDFDTGEQQKITTVSNFALKGRSNTLIDDTLYFYLSIYNGDDLENVLYAMNFTKKEMDTVSENSYTQKLIPVIELNDQVVALQGNTVNDGTLETFIEVIDDNGNAKPVTLQQDKLSTADTLSSSTSQSIVYLAGDNQYLYAIEKSTSNSNIEYYLVKYDLDFTCIESTKITDIFRNYEITDNIGVFYAFGDYFCITDYSGNSILCKAKNDEISVILCEIDLEYVTNSCDNLTYEFFYERNTNAIFKLNNLTGVLEIEKYNLDNNSSVIRCVLSYNNNLLIVKNPTTDDNNEEKIYLIPYDN